MVWAYDYHGSWGYRKVTATLESDSQTSILLITEDNGDGPHHNLIAQLEEWLSGDWDCQLTRAWREANACADWLAKGGISLDRDFLKLRDPPDELTSLRRVGGRGATAPRLGSLQLA